MKLEQQRGSFATGTGVFNSRQDCGLPATPRTAALGQQVLVATVTTNREQEEASALYPEAHALTIDIIDTVEVHFRKDPDPASRRANCEQWGVVYVYENEPEPAPTPAPAPAQPTPANP